MRDIIDYIRRLDEIISPYHPSSEDYSRLFIESTVLLENIDELRNEIKQSQLRASTGYGGRSYAEYYSYEIQLDHPPITKAELVAMYEKEGKQFSIYSFSKNKFFTEHPEISGIIFNKDFVEVNLNSVIDFKLLVDRSHVDSDPHTSELDSVLSAESVEWLTKYMSSPGIGNPTPKVAKELETFNSNKDIVVYRGLGWHRDELALLHSMQTYPFNLNQRVSFKNSKPSSWTTNISVAEYFAHQTGQYYIVIKQTIKPRDILIDTRLINTEVRKTIQYDNQREIILKKGSYQPEIIIIGDKDDDSLKNGWNVDPKEIQTMKEAFQNAANLLTDDYGSKWSFGLIRKHYSGAMGIKTGNDKTGKVIHLNGLTLNKDSWSKSTCRSSENRKEFTNTQELITFLGDKESLRRFVYR